MKNLLNVLVAALIAIGAAFPLVTVAQADGPGEISWDVYDCKGATDCPADTTGELAYGYSGSGTSTVLGAILSARIVCEGYGCPQTWDVYYEISGSMTWDHNTDFGARNVVIEVGGTSTTTHTIPCGSGILGSCSWHIYGMLDGSVLNPNPSVNYHVISSIGMSPQPTGTNYTYDVDVIYSGLPIDTDDCEDWIDDEEIASGTLDPTDEDGDLVELVTGENYRIEVSGGPWNDGADDRYDAAVKLGEEDWRPVSDLVASEDEVECVQHDPDDLNAISWVMEAQDEEFRIRVNDLAAAFADNTGSLDYSVTHVSEISGISSCGDQYLITSGAIGSGTLEAIDSLGETAFTRDVLGHPLPGDYIAIQISGDWQNNGSGDDLQDVALKIGSGSWAVLDGECMEVSYDVGGDPITTIYTQVLSTDAYYLRVGDTDGSWAGNTGELDFVVYVATYSPIQSGCGLEYVLGDYIGQRTVQATSTTGQDYDFGPAFAESVWPMSGEMDRAYKIVAIVTSGLWLDGAGGASSAAAQIRENNPDPAWEDLTTYTEVLCAEQIDPIGHYRVYIAVSPLLTDFSFRVDDDDYSSNSGVLTFQFYQAYATSEAPDPEGMCSGYSLGEIIDTISIPATSAGIKLTGLDEGQYVAIKTDDGPWYDDGVESYEVAVSQTMLAPVVWYELTEFAACSELVDYDHTLNYFLVYPGYDYYVKVNDSDLNLGNNSGSITVIIYDATNEANYWDTCGDAYDLTLVPSDESRTVVPGNISTGTEVLYMDNRTDADGNPITYAIEIRDDVFWADSDETGSYLAEICLAGPGGCTWIPLAEAAEEGLASCVVEVDPDLHTYRIYITPENGDYYLRVADPDDNYPENGGRLIYDVYYANYEDPDDPLPPLPGLPPTWETACATDCYRPESLIIMVGIIPVPDVGGWLSYATCVIVKFFTWCPYHTEALLSMGTTLSEELEPFATFRVFTEFITVNVASIEAITPMIVADSPFSANGTGGANGPPLGSANDPGEPLVVGANPIYTLYPGFDANSNPWFGGDLDLTVTMAEDPERAATISTCTTAFETYVGTGQASMVCQLHYLVTETPFFIALITIMDAVLILFLVFKYAPAYIKRWFNLLSGNRGFVGDILGG